MAIKTGAFELYVQERQLPSKNNEKSRRKSHFFDNLIGNEIGSQTVHERLIPPGASLSASPQAARSLEDSERSRHGSQMVHERSTSSGALLSDSPRTARALEDSEQLINGSQMVHERFTSPGASLSDSLRAARSLEDSEQQINGSQMVHKRFTPLVTNTSRRADDDSNMVDSVNHRRLSRLIGNQRDIVLAIYKNIQMNDSFATKELTLDEISIISGVNKKSLKNTLFRLTSAGFIIRADQKNGRGGWVKYEMNPYLKDEIRNSGILSTTVKRK